MNSIIRNLTRVPHRPSILFKQTLPVQCQLGNVAKAHKSVGTAALKYAVATSMMSLMKLQSKLKAGPGAKPVKKEYPKDTVILCQFPRAAVTPSLSPFGLRLETWIRMANIKYQNELSMARSSRGLIPFIRLNDYVVEDSQFCIEYLTKVFQKDLNAHLTDEQKSIAVAVSRVCENSLFWTVVMHRFWHSDKGLQETKLPKLAYWYFSFRMYVRSQCNGYGLYKKEELYDMGRKDMKAIDTLIGNKKFLFGDKPCDVDASIFGLCAQIKYNDMGPLNQFLNTDCRNLLRYLDNMQATYWPDWDANTQVGRRKLKAAATAAVKK